MGSIVAGHTSNASTFVTSLRVEDVVQPKSDHEHEIRVTGGKQRRNQTTGFFQWISAAVKQNRSVVIKTEEQRLNFARSFRFYGESFRYGHCRHIVASPSR